MSIRSFRDKDTEDIFFGRPSKDALRRLPRNLHRKAQVKLARLAAISCLQDLIEIRGNRCEMLRGKRSGQWSMRINDQYRVCFYWHERDASEVEVVDYHS